MPPNIQHLPKLCTDPIQRLAPLQRPRRLGHTLIIITINPSIILLDLNPRAPLQIPQSLRIQFREIARTPAQTAPVYVIKFPYLGELPLLLEIIDVEFHVGGHEARLDGREVGADYEGARVLVCKFDGPDSGAGADVEYGLGIGDGRFVELAAEAETVDVVLEVETGLFLFVVG